MLITRIDIAGMHHADHDSAMRAHVAITSDKGRVLVDCQLPAQPMEAGPRRMALMHEAIRQLRRMPEYRSGQRQILLADGLLA
jgi:predicted YcjX-like family ATPase